MHAESTVLKKVAACAVAFFMSLAVSQASSPTEHVVEISGMRFEPESLVLRPGDVVTWINRDIVPHTATAVDGSWTTGTLLKNQSKKLTMDRDMIRAYGCAFHPNMIGNLEIGQ